MTQMVQTDLVTQEITEPGDAVRTPSPLPCLACLQLVETQTYQDICTSHFPASRCINNPAASGPTLFYDNKMNERTDAYACANGYCTCSASSA